MIAIKKSRATGPAIPLLLGEKAGMRASYSPAQPLTKTPNRVQSFSPRLPCVALREARATPGITSQNSTANSEAAQSAKFICGHPIRPICRIRSMPPGHSRCEPLIKVENGPRTPLSPTCYKPLIRPENKGIKPNANRHRPKKFIVGLCTWRPCARTVSFVTLCRKFRSFCPFCQKIQDLFCETNPIGKIINSLLFNEKRIF